MPFLLLLNEFLQMKAILFYYMISMADLNKHAMYLNIFVVKLQ